MMTTTELIKLLQDREFGGATGRPREISFYINDSFFIPDPKIEVCGSGDGLFTTLELNLVTDKQVKHQDTTSFERYDEGIFCYECGKSFPENEFKTFAKHFKHCPNCGRNVTKIAINIDNTTDTGNKAVVTDEQVQHLINLLGRVVSDCRLAWNESIMDWEWEYALEASQLLQELQNKSTDN